MHDSDVQRTRSRKVDSDRSSPIQRRTGHRLGGRKGQITRIPTLRRHKHPQNGPLGSQGAAVHAGGDGELTTPDPGRQRCYIGGVLTQAPDGALAALNDGVLTGKSASFVIGRGGCLRNWLRWNVMAGDSCYRDLILMKNSDIDTDQDDESRCDDGLKVVVLHEHRDELPDQRQKQRNGNVGIAGRCRLARWPCDSPEADERVEHHRRDGQSGRDVAAHHGGTSQHDHEDHADEGRGVEEPRRARSQTGPYLRQQPSDARFADVRTAIGSETTDCFVPDDKDRGGKHDDGNGQPGSATSQGNEPTRSHHRHTDV